MVEKYGRIAFVPEALPLAPRPIPAELISSWLLGVSFANGLTLAQLIEAIETRFPGLSLQRFNALSSMMNCHPELALP